MSLIIPLASSRITVKAIPLRFYVCLLRDFQEEIVVCACICGLES